MSSISMSRLLAHWARQHPRKVAIAHGDETIDWQTLEHKTNRLARAYAELGVAENDFVTIALPNCLEFFEAVFATWKLGATPQPVSAKLPKIERDQIVDIADPKLVVGVDEQQGSAPWLPASFTPNSNLPDTELPERTSASIKAMTSGGSTGRPKLIVAKQPAKFDPQTPFFDFPMASSVLVPGPLYHNGPFIWAFYALFKGNQVTVTSRFDAAETLALIEKWQVEMLYVVPTMMQRIWALPKEDRLRHDLSSLRRLWHLSAPCPAWLKQKYIGWLGADVIWEAYGGTEGIGTTTISGRDWLEHKGSVGKPDPSCEIKIVGENGETLPARKTGEIYLRPKSGPGTTYEYVGAKAKTIEGGWESLGDIGHLDGDGFLYISDRLSDMILTGGANVYPAEVEAAIDAFPGVRSSAVVGLPHEDLGSTVHAIVDVPADNVSADDLLSHLADHLVRYKIPRSVEFVSEPLRDDSGKVRRRALRDARV